MKKTMIKRQDSSQFVIEKECMVSNRAITLAQIAKIEEKRPKFEIMDPLLFGGARARGAFAGFVGGF